MSITRERVNTDPESISAFGEYTTGTSKLAFRGNLPLIASAKIYHRTGCAPGQVLLRGSSSRIVDVPGVPKKIIFFKPVWHERMKRDTKGSEGHCMRTSPRDSWGNYYVYEYDSNCCVTAAAWLSYHLQSAAQIPIYQLDSAILAGYQQLRNGLNSPRADVRINAAVFMAELKDFKSLYTSATGMSDILKYLLKGGHTNMASVTETLLKASADARLQWSFAIAPFLSDMKKLKSQSKVIADYIKQWQTAARRGDNFVATCNMTHLIKGEIPANNDNEFSYVDQIGHNPSVIVNHTSKIKYTEKHDAKLLVHLGYKPGLIKNPDIIRDLMHLDAQGFGDVGDTVWNLIPFSFLIDYYYSVGKLIKSLDVTLTNLPISDAYLGYSITSTRSTRCTVVDSEGIGTSSQEDRIYQRARLDTLPNMDIGNWFDVKSNLLEFKVPMNGQLLNILALLASLVAKRGRV